MRIGDSTPRSFSFVYDIPMDTAASVNPKYRLPASPMKIFRDRDKL